MTGTLLHKATAELTTRFTTVADAVAGMTVTDGPAWEPGVIALEVGWNGDDRDGAEVSRARNNASGIGGTEDITVYCLLSNHDGSLQVADARAVVEATFAALLAVVEADTSLGGLVSGAYVSSIGYRPHKDTGSALATFAFAVSMTAFP